MASKFVGIVLLALTIGAAAQTTVPPKSRGARSAKPAPRARAVDDTIARAEAAIDKKDFSAAEALLQSAVKSDPSDFRAWYNLGFVYAATRRPQDAIAAYRKSVAAKPDAFESNYNLGLALAKAADPSAEKYLRVATGLKPPSNPEENLARAWTALGILLQKSNPKESLAAYAKLSQLRPNDPVPHLAAAAVADESRDFATAEREYLAAEKLDPKSADAVAGLANVYMASQRFEDAEQALRRYLALAASVNTPASQLATAHAQLGRVLLELHRRPEAIPELETALKLAPSDPTASRQIAWLYMEDKQYDKAEQAFRVLLASAPNDANARHGLGSALLFQRKFPEAEKELIAAVRLKSDLAPAYGDLATAANENKNYPLALKALDYRARFLPENPGTLFLRATVLDHLGDKVNASKSYRDFLAMADGKYPDQEWQARHRLIAIDPKKK